MKFIVCTSPDGGGRRELCAEIQVILTSCGYKTLTDAVSEDPVKHMDNASYIYENVLDYLIIKLVDVNAIKMLETIYQAYPNSVYVLTDRTDASARNSKAVGKNNNLARVEQQAIDLHTFITHHGMDWTTASIPSFNKDFNILTGNLGATRLVAVLGAIDGN